MGYLRIRSRHQPFEVAALVMAPICGVLLLVLDVRPTSVQMSMPVPIQVGWEIGLIAVGVGGLSGILWPGRLATGLGIELASVLVFGTISGMYTMALLVVSGRQSVAAASFITALAVGSLWRAAQIAIDLRRLARAIQCTNGEPIKDGVT
ncbi:hypothetical protein ACTWLT_03280 [Micromonospora sp. ZYX-F-536]|uniref:hypothetical protein n=1 Tax=Micromonospora sp. ZYX-F-536 TaxID=3457629 RepID=UPI004040B4CD